MSGSKDTPKPVKADVPPAKDSKTDLPQSSGPVSVYRSYPTTRTKKKGTGAKKVVYTTGKTPPLT
jgi:hypothetical protein